MWTGAKGSYKVEPVFADGGEAVRHRPVRTTRGNGLPRDPWDD